MITTLVVFSVNALEMFDSTGIPFISTEAAGFFFFLLLLLEVIILLGLYPGDASFMAAYSLSSLSYSYYSFYNLASSLF